MDREYDLVGHVVLRSADKDGEVSLDQAPGCEPNLKRHRHEPQASSTGVVEVAQWCAASLREALRAYALAVLEQAGDASMIATFRACVSAHPTYPLLEITQTPSGTAFDVASFSFAPRLFGSGNSEIHGSATSMALTSLLPLPSALFIAPSRTLSTVIVEKRTRMARAITNSGFPVHKEPLLLVGAGGIGCEVLKALVLDGFTCIHVVDLDTIDATNLNRQFLFQVGDVGSPKALTARRVVLDWFQKESSAASTAGPARTTPEIVAYHDNIKADHFDDNFFKSFRVVLNALDNVSARQHVNRMCMRNNVPLIESGTMGYNGQVQPIIKGVYECYDCRPKPPDTKTFAVCTIHARPTTMVHCVHYAKELYDTLFVGSTSEKEETANAEEREDGKPAEEGELTYLKRLLQDWRPSSAPTQQEEGRAVVGIALLRALFVDKIEQLLAMKSSWSTAPPQPLPCTSVDPAVQAMQSLFDRHAGGQRGHEDAVALLHLSRDEKLPLLSLIQLFLAATQCCWDRIQEHPESSGSFKKEDDMAVDFVAATANLRARAFHIEEHSIEEVRSIAGAIVPAIATTNAIIAASVVHELKALLQGGGEKAVYVVYARRTPQCRRRRVKLGEGLSASLYASPSHAVTAQKGRIVAVQDRYLLHSTIPNGPEEAGCTVCQDVTPEVTVRLNLTTTTLSSFVKAVVEEALDMECPSISFGAVIVYEDEDYETLGPKNLSSLVGMEVPSSSAFVFTVDALNKDVPWRLALQHDEEQSPFEIRGREAAEKAETKALQRKAQEEALRHAEAAAAEEEERRLQAAILVEDGGALVIDSSDDEVEVQVDSTSQKQAPLRQGDDEVIELD